MSLSLSNTSVMDSEFIPKDFWDWLSITKIVGQILLNAKPSI